MILTVIHAGTTTAAHIIRTMPTVISLPDKPPPRQEPQGSLWGDPALTGRRQLSADRDESDVPGGSERIGQAERGDPVDVGAGVHDGVRHAPVGDHLAGDRDSLRHERP